MPWAFGFPWPAGMGRDRARRFLVTANRLGAPIGNIKGGWRRLALRQRAHFPAPRHR
jgi:hypothetical protein